MFAVLNTSPTKQTVDVAMTDVFYDQGQDFAQQRFSLYDLWQKDASGKWAAKFGDVTGSVKVDVNSHGARVFKLRQASGVAGVKRSESEL